MPIVVYVPCRVPAQEPRNVFILQLNSFEALVRLYRATRREGYKRGLGRFHTHRSGKEVHAMTNVFATRIARSAGAAILAFGLATSVGAQSLWQISEPAPVAPRSVIMLFDVQSARLTSEARTIVLTTVDAAERAHAGRIELAAYAAPDEIVRDPELAARRAAAVKEQIANYGFQGLVVVDDEAPEVPLARLGDDTFDRLAILHIGR
jgi:hypothetical protein